LSYIETLPTPADYRTTHLPTIGGEYQPQSSKAGLIKASRELEVHIMGSIDPIDAADSGPVYFENNVVFAIRDWSEALGYHLLRIGGPADTKYPSGTSEISASVVKTAYRFKLATLYVSCNSLPQGKEKSIVSTLYSLTNQLINQVNPLDTGVFNFSTARFQDLDGTVETWDKAISIFSDLLVYAPSPLFIVFDNIERLDGIDSDKRYLDTLINILKDQASSQNLSGGIRKVLKILFITTGPCETLNKLDDKVLKNITIKRQDAKRRPGEPRLGRSQIHLLMGKKDE
jgi:hypothetical protein